MDFPPNLRPNRRAKRGPVAWRRLRVTRERAALALALAAHAAVWLGARSFDAERARTRSANDSSALNADSIELDLTEPAPGAAPRLTTLERHAALRAPSSPRVRAPTPEPVSTPSTEALLDAADLAPSPPALASSSPESKVGPIDLGLAPDGWHLALLGAPPDRPAPSPADRRAPLVRAPVPSKTGGLLEGLEARDRELGLGPAGRVASALYQAAHGDGAPITGVARFNVTVHRTGSVEVSLADVKDQAWRKVAERAAEDLRRSPPRIPPPRDGYRLTLKLTAEEVLPNGTKRKTLHAPRLGARAPRLQSSETSLKELERLNPSAGVGPETEDLRERRAITELPGIHVSTRGKVCSSRVGVAPLGPKDGKRVPVASLDVQGECDPANLGARVQRVVRTQVELETPF
jgi:hypothetical protein